MEISVNNEVEDNRENILVLYYCGLYCSGEKSIIARNGRRIEG